MKKRLITLMLSSVMILSMAYGCSETNPSDATQEPVGGVKYDGPYSEVNGTYGGVDDLGRVLSLDTDVQATRSDRDVGIFYFLWQGEHGTSGPHDNYAIYNSDNNSVKSEDAWIAAGGGARGAHHFWAEPLFGYYKSTDAWVLRKHVQMLTDAGVDYIVFDATNAYSYVARVRELIEIWYEYMEMGFDVPKIAYYTNSSSGATINTIYKEVYNNTRLNERYPRLSELWYQWDGKPMIVGVSSDPVLTDEAKSYFYIKESQWPNAAVVNDDSFPWMEFGRSLTDAAVYGKDGRKEVVNVSIAQHSVTGNFSISAWYGGQDRTRSWHNGANDTSENAVLYGYNFAEQWEWALTVDPETIFVTGWNEWVAQRQPSYTSVPIVFVDCCDPNTSRDAEPMKGLFGDNYYMQLIDYIRKYKGTDARVNVGDNVTIDIEGSFDQWNSDSVTAKYVDYTNDTVDRDNEKGFGTLRYENYTGRNDFVNIKTARDDDNLYFYADTNADITAATDDNWMTLFISSGVEGNAVWSNMYDYAVNLVKPNGNDVIISKYNEDGTWSEAGTGKMKVEGNKIMISVSRETLGNKGALVDVQFKWADNYQLEDGKLDIWSFYEDGDVAPYGRMNYVFSEKK